MTGDTPGNGGRHRPIPVAGERAGSVGVHRERRLHLSEGRPKEYDDRITRHRLRQAFGRLIRRADDKGVFLMLDAACPTRLFAGLPPGTEVQRMGLAEAVELVGAFLKPD